ncbi:MAG: TIM barrel protein [Dehalococcoidia bacterium]|nr:TIM barrel protein [Dehalococcoidia bacterium]
MIRAANAPCSFGMVTGAGDPDHAAWEQVLDEIAEAGYEGTELGDWGFMPEDPDLVRAELARRRLAMAGAFVPVRLADPSLHAAAEDFALRTARLLAGCVRGTPEEGLPFVILADDPVADPVRTANAGRIRPEHGWTRDQWQAAAAGCDRLARAVKDQTGLRTAFHHHGASFVETPSEIETLLDLTDSALLGLCLDTGHYEFAGGDAREAAQRFAGRIWHVHFKDCDPAAMERARRERWDYPEALRRGVFRGLGEGVVANSAVLDGLRRLDYSGWIVVENEAPPGGTTPLQRALADRDYLRGLGL